jgi:biopolymer transport protein ExbB/TolQ
MREIESKREMTAFFEKNLASGREAEEIYSILLNQGYPKSLINAGYNEAADKIRKRKEAEAEKQRPVVEEAVPITVEKKQSFFGKLFGKK